MNVFEDLVVELKQENLLETTVVETDIDDSHNAFDETEVPNRDYDLPAYDLVASDGGEAQAIVPEASDEDAEMAIHETEVVDVAEPVEHVSAPARPKANAEFFKKKAVAEVSSLQMVEHVITGVEREYLKLIPKPFDDFNAKKALSTFLNTSDAGSSEEHATAEYNLMHETESWCTALAVRDREVPVSALRQYCERSRPALSSQALLSLGRFYRNLPYSEQVRSKFDFVITRLFSRAVGQEKRVCLFKREEMLGHINTLYSDWSSIPLYAVDEDDSKVMLTALSFEDLAIEAENAASFDQLIESDFFGRLRMFKESIAELFYAPQVAAAAIDCNIRIGNAYVELIDRERQKLDSDSLRLKYGEHDLTVSEVTGKTLELPDLLKQLGELTQPMAPAAEAPVQSKVFEPIRVDNSKYRKVEADEPLVPPDPTVSRIKASLRSVNKWLLIFSGVMIAASIGLFIWANFAAGEKASTNNVKAYDITNTPLAAHIKAARVSGEMFYAQMQPSFDKLSKEKKEEFLKQVYQAAVDTNCSQVTLIGQGGKTIGYASATKLEVDTK